MGDLAGTSHEVRPRQVQSPGRDLSSIARGQRSTIGAERQAGDGLEATGHQRRANELGAFDIPDEHLLGTPRDRYQTLVGTERDARDGRGLATTAARASRSARGTGP